MSLEEVFKTFSGGHSDMDGRTFVKVCKDCGLYDKKFIQTNADLIFTKVKERQTRKITFEQFKIALQQIADLKKSSIGRRNGGHHQHFWSHILRDKDGGCSIL